jgi:hypothetical protein
MDAAMHAIVAEGHHGQDGSIQNWQCQACGGHASDRYGTFLYRLKKPETVMAQTLTSVSQGGIRATALSQGVNKDTVLAWWLRLGEHAPVWWDEIAQGKVRVGAVQLDELHTLIRKRGNHLTEVEAQVGEVGVQWVWTAMDPVHQLLWVAQVGSRTRDMACRVVHALCQVLAPGCVPGGGRDIAGRLELYDEDAPDPHYYGGKQPLPKIVVSESSLQCKGNTCQMTCTPFNPEEARVFDFVGTLRMGSQPSQKVLLENVKLEASRRLLGEKLGPIPTGTFQYSFP